MCLQDQVLINYSTNKRKQINYHSDIIFEQDDISIIKLIFNHLHMRSVYLNNNTVLLPLGESSEN